MANRSYRLFYRLILLCIALLVSFPASRAQNPEDSNALLQKAIEKFKPTETGKTRFVYRELIHQINYSPKGKKKFEGTKLFETIYLYDKEYKRLLEINGRPLDGKALLDEKKRYEDAVNQHNGLDTRQRTEQAHGHFVSININLRKLTTLFDSRLLRYESMNGQECAVFDSLPKASLPEAPKRHVTVWIDIRSHEFVKIAFDLLDDEESLLKGSSGWLRMKTIDGISVDTEHFMDYQVTDKSHKEIARVVINSTFSDYKRFASSSRILSPDEEPSIPAAPQP